MIARARKLSPHRLERRELRVVDENTRSFYTISSQENLAVLGASYVEEFERGCRSFGFSSSCYKTTQQRMALAVASYFEHLYDMRILILTASAHTGLFKDFILKGDKKVEDGVEMIGFYHHFDFITLDDKNSERILHYVNTQETFDLLIWDLPLLSVSSNKYLSEIGSLTVITPPSIRSSDSVEVKKHFDSYGIDISGVKIRHLGDGLT